MTPDRLKGWLSKIPKGAKLLELCVEDKGVGLAELAVWERQEVIDLKGSEADVADAILLMATEYTEGEETRQGFVLRWHGQRGKILRSATHWENPKKPESAEDDAPSSTWEKVIKECLRSNNNKDKAMLETLKASTAAHKASMEAYEKTIGMLTQRLNTALQTIDETAAPPEAIAVVVSDVEEAEIAQRTAALKVLTEKLPDVVEMGITAVATMLLDKEDVDARVAKGVAEAAAAAAAAAAGAGAGGDTH